MSFHMFRAFQHIVGDNIKPIFPLIPCPKTKTKQEKHLDTEEVMLSIDRAKEDEVRERERGQNVQLL